MIDFRNAEHTIDKNKKWIVDEFETIKNSKLKSHLSFSLYISLLRDQV